MTTTTLCERPGKRYEQGCRCLSCRVVNAEKARKRRAVLRTGLRNIAEPDAAREHLIFLSKCGVGRTSVAAACDISETVLQRIRQGRRRYIRRETEQKILSVTPDAFSEGSKIDATETWKKVNQLLREGFTRAELARRMGLPKPELRWRHSRVTGSTAVRVEKFYRMVMAGGDDE